MNKEARKHGDWSQTLKNEILGSGDRTGLLAIENNGAAGFDEQDVFWV